MNRKLFLLNSNVINLESGRRAFFSNRSIIADPNDKMKDLINEKVKHRQWFRPTTIGFLKYEVRNFLRMKLVVHI